MNRISPIPVARAADVKPPAEPADSRPSQRLAILSIVGFWIVYFCIASFKSLAGDLPAQEFMLMRRVIVTIAAMGLTWLLYLLLRRFEAASTAKLLTIAFIASAPLALAYASINYIAFFVFPIPDHIAIHVASGRAEKGPASAILFTAIDWYFFIATWAVMWIAISYSAKVRHAERQAAHFAQAAQQAELRALRYQVNPHFLFNTLNSLSSLVMRSRAAEAEQMILNLSAFFRASLTREAIEDATLADEVRLQLLYLDIEKVRFPERLIVKVCVPDSLSDALVPALILQPLVENAIKYGVSRSQKPVTVTIAAQAHDGTLELSVTDDGATAPTQEEAGCGVGLANVTARLAASYGDAARCVSGPLVDGGWMVRLSLPLVQARQHAPA